MPELARVYLTLSTLPSDSVQLIMANFEPIRDDIRFILETLSTISSAPRHTFLGTAVVGPKPKDTGKRLVARHSSLRRVFFFPFFFTEICDPS